MYVLKTLTLTSIKEEVMFLCTQSYSFHSFKLNQYIFIHTVNMYVIATYFM